MSEQEYLTRYRFKIPYLWDNRKGFKEHLDYAVEGGRIHAYVIEHWPHIDNRANDDNPVVVITLNSAQQPRKGESIEAMCRRVLTWISQAGERIDALEELSEALK